MKLIRFSLVNFKNYPEQLIECAPKWNCFVGKNGMGKTNLLDAIYYLAVGKSFHGLSDTYLMKKSEEFFRLDSFFEIEDKKERIVAKVIPRVKKELERNQVPYKKISEHLGLVPIVFIAPDDTALVKEGSEIRRKFIDNTLSQLDRTYLSHLINYNKLLKQRNSLLKQFAENKTFNAALLSVYSQQMAAPSQYIFERRQAFIDIFRPILVAVASQLSSNHEEVDCFYKSHLAENTLEVIFKENEAKDRLLQRTTAGVHRDDLVFSINELPLKRFASQGQLKTFVLALKLAQYELLRQQTNKLPLLLLDDIFDKLDETRVANLLKILKTDAFGQIFITDTHRNRITSILKDFDASFNKYLITNGSASLQSN